MGVWLDEEGIDGIIKSTLNEIEKLITEYNNQMDQYELEQERKKGLKIEELEEYTELEEPELIYCKLFKTAGGKDYCDLIEESREFAAEKYLFASFGELDFIINQIPMYIDENTFLDGLNTSLQLVEEAINEYNKKKSEEGIDKDFTERLINILGNWIKEWYYEAQSEDMQEQNMMSKEIVEKSLRRFLSFHIFSLFSYNEAFYNEVLRELIKISLDNEDPVEMKFKSNMLTKGNPYKKIKEILNKLGIPGNKNKKLNFLLNDFATLVELRNKAAHGDPTSEFISYYKSKIRDKNFKEYSWKDKVDIGMLHVINMIKDFIIKFDDTQSSLQDRNFLSILVEKFVDKFRKCGIKKKLDDPVKDYVTQELKTIVEYATGVEHFTNNTIELALIADNIVFHQLNHLNHLNKNNSD